MKNFVLLTLYITLYSHLGFSQTEKSPAISAAEFSQALVTENYDVAYAFFSSSFSQQISAEKLKEVWGQLQGQLGSLKEKQAPKLVTEDAQVITYQPMQFENSLLDLKLTFDDAGKIIGMFFVPHKVFELDLINNEHLFEEEITVTSGKEIELRGIISLPKTTEKVPAIILVHGSGPNDMDETYGPNKLFKDLAHKLAANGIAVIRYDKRTKTYGGSPKLDLNSLTLYEETIEDAISAVDLAAKDKRIDKNNIFVLGHSLGGMSAPQIGMQSKRSRGIIILAGNARPLQDVVTEQYDYLFSEDGTISKEEALTIDNYQTQLEALRELQKTGNTSAQLPFGLPVAYWEYILAYDQVETAIDLEKPILVLQGKRDYQVTTEDFEVWKEMLENKENVSFKLYEKLNHQMREGEGLSYPSEYDLKSPLPDYFTDDIAAWIFSQK